MLTLVAGLIVEGEEDAGDGASLRVAAVPVESHKGLHTAVWSSGQLVRRPPDPISMPVCYLIVSDVCWHWKNVMNDVK